MIQEKPPVQVKEQKPISQKYACKDIVIMEIVSFFVGSRDADFQYSFCKIPNAIFLHILTRTGALAL